MICGRLGRLYGEPCSTQPHPQSSAGNLRDHTGDGGQRRDKFGKFNHSGRVAGKLFMNDDLLCVSSFEIGSAHLSVCMVTSMIARAAI